MKLVSYLATDKSENIGLVIDNKIFNLQNVDSSIPSKMADFLNGGESLMNKARNVEGLIKSGKGGDEVKTYQLIAPVPHPTSCRDGYAFRQHVASARRNRKLGMLPEFDQYPVFYFTNHNAISGPGEVYCMPDHFDKLDFELEAAIVIGKKGRNIKAEQADNYIAGYMIMNDLSARTLQMEEMLLNLGPAKGKDFSTVIGPWLVTPDELEQYKTKPKEGHVGNNYDLKMRCWVNGKEVSTGSLGDMDWTFAELIERASYGVDIFPGDVIGSGTVGTGCFLELNGTSLLNDPSFKPQWIQPNDVVEMEITGLGRLINTIKKEDSDWSLLKIKKEAVQI